MGHPLKSHLKISTNRLPETDFCDQIKSNIYELRIENLELILFDKAIVEHLDEYFCNTIYLISSNNKYASKKIVDLLDLLYSTVDVWGSEKLRRKYPDSKEISAIRGILKTNNGEWGGRYWYQRSEKEYSIRTTLTIENSNWIKDLLCKEDLNSTTEIEKLFLKNSKRLVLKLASFDTIHGSMSFSLF